jgi:hypothetical protein
VGDVTKRVLVIPFVKADETMRFERARADIAHFPAGTVTRWILAPGWRWSSHVGSARRGSRCARPLAEAVSPIGVSAVRSTSIPPFSRPAGTSNQVTSQCAESGDRRIDESGDRRASFAEPQAWHVGHLTRG